MKILFVEDHEDDLVSQSKVLCRDGYEMLMARSAESALSMLELDAEVDAVIFDVRMPGMDGFEFLEHLRSDPRWVKMPAIIRTALRIEDIPERIVNLGFALVQKPTSMQELELALASVCGADKLPTRAPTA